MCEVREVVEVRRPRIQLLVVVVVVIVIVMF